MRYTDVKQNVADDPSDGTPILAKKHISKKRIARIESPSDDVGYLNLSFSINRNLMLQ